MGLDMYLTAKRYIWQHKEPEKRELVASLGLVPERLKLVLKQIEFEAAYWRKANHIHNWFVNNVQNAEDECKEHWVSLDQLRELLTVCQRVLDDRNLAPILLPTKSGFFFGATEIGDWYWDDIEYTVERLTCLLADESELADIDFYYQSSW